MDIGTYDEVPKDLSPLDEERMTSKKRGDMLKRAEKEMRVKRMEEKRLICTGTSSLFDISMKLKEKWDAEDKVIRLEAESRTHEGRKIKGDDKIW